MLKKHWFTKENLKKHDMDGLEGLNTIPNFVKFVRECTKEDGAKFASLSEAVHDVTRVKANDITFRIPGNERKDFLFIEAGSCANGMLFAINPDFDWDNYEKTAESFPERKPEDASEEELLRIIARKCFESFKLDTPDSPESKNLPNDIKNFLHIWRRRFS